jgi:spermidine/putrescine transport system ATP-binding protein
LAGSYNRGESVRLIAHPVGGDVARYSREVLLETDQDTDRPAEQDARPDVPDLVVESVRKSFDDVTAVDGVSFELARGEFYSLLGPSGCGKTTTLRMVAGFEQPDGGRILLAGDDVTNLPPNKRNVNTVFQQYALFPHLTVEANVAYGLRQKRLPKEEAAQRLAEALLTVRLHELRDRYPRQLSGGQQQRVALARALVNRPTVLLLDEPLAALDLKLRKAMQSELKKLQERVGITFLYVTHDQEEALTLSDRIAVMNEGRVLQEGTPEEIYERPRSRFVADFIGQTNFFEGVVEEAGPEGTVVRVQGGLKLRCAPANVGPGDLVSVALRPEKIRPASGAEGNRVAGTLVRLTYLGDILQYHVLLAGGTELICQRQNQPDAAGPRWVIGEQVEVAWPESSALVMPADEEVAQEQDLRLLAQEGPPAGDDEGGGHAQATG